MGDQLLEYQLELRMKNEAFVLATVVRREAPTSGKTGDKALINKLGEITGWVGGGCVKGILIKEAADAMKTGKSRLVIIGQSLQPSKKEGIMEYKMSCHSEGTVELFIDPVLPAPHLVVIGKTAIARAVIRLAGTLGYRITVVGQPGDSAQLPGVHESISIEALPGLVTSRNSFITVATQGEGDETALETSLKKQRDYLGFVSSKKKMESLKNYLRDAGLQKEAIDSIHSPAGLDIGAKSPEEVAVSIVAQIIQVRSELLSKGSFETMQLTGSENKEGPSYYINPVCGVPVDMNQPKYIIEYKGESVYFCCDGCKVKFEKDPEKFIQNRALGMAPEGM
jgi:xanthine dehydrogenase accessory factor